MVLTRRGLKETIYVAIQAKWDFITKAATSAWLWWWEKRTITPWRRQGKRSISTDLKHDTCTNLELLVCFPIWMKSLKKKYTHTHLFVHCGRTTCRLTWRRRGIWWWTSGGTSPCCLLFASVGRMWIKWTHTRTWVLHWIKNWIGPSKRGYLQEGPELALVLEEAQVL